MAELRTVHEDGSTTSETIDVSILGTERGRELGRLWARQQEAWDDYCWRRRRGEVDEETD